MHEAFLLGNGWEKGIGVMGLWVHVEEYYQSTNFHDAKGMRLKNWTMRSMFCEPTSLRCQMKFLAFIQRYVSFTSSYEIR